MIPRAWVVTLFRALVCLLLVVLPGAFSADESVQLSESFGGPHGTEFSDQASVAAGQTIGSITIRAAERVDGISLEVTGPKAVTFNHGGSGGKAYTLTLAKEEYITSMEAHWGVKKGRTRIFYLSFGTSAGNTVSGGSQTESKNTVTAPKGFQLGGFFGQDGDELDKLGAIWTRISAEAPATADPAPAPTPAAAPEPASGSGADSTFASAESSGSAEAPTKQNAASNEDTALSSDEASGSDEAPAKKKKAAAAPKEDSAAGSGSTEVPVKKKKAAAVVTKKKKAAPATSSEGSEVESTEDSASASADASGSAEAPVKKKKAGAKVSKKKKAAAVTSSEDSASASDDASGSAEAPTTKKRTAPVGAKTKKAATATSSDGSDAESIEDSASASADASGSAEAPLKKKKTAVVSKKKKTAVVSKKKKAAAVTSNEDSASASDDASGSAEAPTTKKRTAPVGAKTKKAATAVASSDGSEVESIDDSTSASADASGSAEAPTTKKRTAPVGAKTKKAATAVASSDGSEVESIDDSTSASADASGSAEAPTTKKRTAPVGAKTKKTATAVASSDGSEVESIDDSTSASADASGSAEAPTTKKRTAPVGAKTKKAATAVASSDGSEVESIDDSTSASADASGSAEAPTTKKRTAPVGAKTKKAATAVASSDGSEVESIDDSTSASADASGSAEAPTTKKRTAPVGAKTKKTAVAVASSDGSEVESIDDSTSASADASGSAEAPTTKKRTAPVGAKTKKAATAVASSDGSEVESIDDSTSASADASGSAEAPTTKKRTAPVGAKTKKAATAVASSDGSEVESIDDSTSASADASGSAEAPTTKKRTAPVGAKTKKAATAVASSDGSEVESIDDSTSASADASGSAEAPTTKKRTAPVGAKTKKAATAVASSDGSEVESIDDSTSASADASGSAEAPTTKKRTAPVGAKTKKTATAVASSDGSEVESIDDSTSASADTSGSAEAPTTKKKTAPVGAKTKKAATAVASSDGSEVESIDDSTSASADASGSAEAPTTKKRTAPVGAKTKKAATATSSDGSDAESIEDSASASADASGSAEAPLKKKKTAVVSKKKKAAAVTSNEDSASASDDASGSAEAPTTKKRTAPVGAKTKKAATAVASSDGSEVESIDDSTSASADTSGSAEAPTTKKKTGAVVSKKKKTAAVTSNEDSALASDDASGSAEAPIKKKKSVAAASSKDSAVESTEDSALASGEASGSADAPTKKKKAATTSSEDSAVESTADSAATSLDSSAAASDAGSAAESSSAATALAGSGDSTDGSMAASTAGSVATSTAGSSEPTQNSAATPPAGSGPAGTEAPAAPTMSVKDSVVLSESFGGPHGRDFSDKNYVNSGQTVSQISIYAGERLDGISLEISAPKSQTFTHGGTGGDRKVLKLGEKEYINSMEVHWGKKDGRTRIFYVNFATTAGNSLSGGSMTDDKSTVTAPEGFQLAGFFGKDGKEIDTLGAVWAYIDLVTPAPTPAPAPVTIEDSPGTLAPEDIAGSLSEISTKANKRPVQLSDSFGGPHGEQFSDQLACTSGMTISSVTIRAGERLDGLTVQVAAPKEMTFTHGGTGGTENTLTLEAGEYITKMDVNVGQRKGHTRIFYINLTTNKGRTVSGGSETKEKSSVTAPRGYQLAGFFGRYGDEMDLIGAVWSSIAAVNETTSTVKVSSEDDIALGELFGGPHGNAFSDINAIKFGQTISSITLRSAKRVDAVTLQVAAPMEMTLDHGGRGGTEQTITLATDEYITSMEAHWDKKDKHTRVFYIKFTTTAGQTIEGGTKTGKSGNATAPEGFVLSGFYGRAADEVDQIGAIWTRKTAKNVLLTDPSGVGNGTYGTTIRNWVGPTIGKNSDTACYRKYMPYDSNTICPLGYSKDGDDCAARCPLSYPISCGLECIPQNDDCVLAVLSKIGSVVAVALNAATGGVFGRIYAAYKIAKWVVLCVRNIVEVIRGLIYYLRYRQTSAPIGDTAEMLNIAYQADVVVFDLPIAVCTCMNIPVPKNAEFADIVLQVVEGIVKQAITNGDEIISTGANVMNLLTGSGMANSSRTTVDELDELVTKNSSCGWQLKRLTDRVTRAVLKYRNSSTSVDDIRVKVYKSSIVLNDIPIVTNNCMGELLAGKTRTAAYETRDLLRKTFGVIVDQLIDTGKTDGGKDVAEDDYMLKTANMGLVVLSAFDPTGIAYMASQFVQPICGPTAYVGEIDDGTLHDALGLKTVDEAFIGSYGSYTHAGDGVVRLIFESVDTKDVTVVVHSGGDGYTKVDVGAGDVTTWEATFPELEDKTLYLDRWRPGLFGLPGKGGGSLLMWIPRSSEGGHITMHVRINPS